MSATKQKSARLNPAAKKKLEQIQAQTARSQTSLLDRAIDLLERETLAQQVEADFADLANNNDALRRYNELSTAFDGAAADGLQKE